MITIHPIPKSQWPEWEAMLRESCAKDWGAMYRRPRFFRDYIDHDPTFRREHLLGLYLRSTLIGAYQVFDRQVRIGRQGYRLAGLGNFGIHVDYQGQGYGSLLLRHFMDLAKHSYDAAIAYSGRPSFYTRLGWLSLVRAPMLLSALPPHCMEREATVRDIPLLARLYASTGQYLVRSLCYWRTWVLWKWHRYRLQGRLVLHHGKPVGYYVQGKAAAKEIEECVMPRAHIPRMTVLRDQQKPDGLFYTWNPRMPIVHLLHVDHI